MDMKTSPLALLNDPSLLTTDALIKKLQNTIAKDCNFELIDEVELYQHFAKTPRSNCVLDNRKLLATGIKMRSVDEAIDHCLTNWITALI